MSAKKEWEKFKVGAPSTRANWTEPDCAPLDYVAHVAHVPAALRIVEDARLRADLVYDESKLNTHRIRVAWLSPNDWDGAGGFRYGNIRFSFDWTTLVYGKNYYWVESIAYGVRACRILVTDEDRSTMLDVYDPTVGNGPWWRSPSGEHYWNSNHCLEVMFEGDLTLERATDVDFVTHHRNRCSIDYRTCRFCGVEKYEGGAEFIAALASRSATINLPGLIKSGDGGSAPSWGLSGAMRHVLRRCREAKIAAWGHVPATEPGARPLARAVLAAIGNPAISGDLATVAAQFKSLRDLQFAVADVIAAAIGLPDSKRLFDDQSDVPF